MALLSFLNPTIFLQSHVPVSVHFPKKGYENSMCDWLQFITIIGKTVGIISTTKIIIVRSALQRTASKWFAHLAIHPANVANGAFSILYESSQIHSAVNQGDNDKCILNWDKLWKVSPLNPDTKMLPAKKKWLTLWPNFEGVKRTFGENSGFIRSAAFGMPQMFLVLVPWTTNYR